VEGFEAFYRLLSSKQLHYWDCAKLFVMHFVFSSPLLSFAVEDAEDNIVFEEGQGVRPMPF